MMIINGLAYYVQINVATEWADGGVPRGSTSAATSSVPHPVQFRGTPLRRRRCRQSSSPRLRRRRRRGWSQNMNWIHLTRPYFDSQYLKRAEDFFLWFLPPNLLKLGNMTSSPRLKAQWITSLVSLSIDFVCVISKSIMSDKKG